MGNTIEVSGIVKQKCVDKTSSEYTIYIPKENQLVIVKDGSDYSLVRGDGVNTVNNCVSVSGDSELPINQNLGIKLDSTSGDLALREATPNAIQNNRQ